MKFLLQQQGEQNLPHPFSQEQLSQADEKGLKHLLWNSEVQ